MKPPAGIFTEYEESIIAKWEEYRHKIGETPHGSRTRYTSYGCRCDACVATQGSYKRAIRAVRRGMMPPLHGLNGYAEYGCRCDACATAWRLKGRSNQDARRGREPRAHGVNGYKSYTCRCDICRSAMSLHDKQRRTHAKAKS